MEKKQKMYGLFWKDKRNRLWGYVEDSFGMSWNKNRVRVWVDNGHYADLVTSLMQDVKDTNRKNKQGGKFFLVRLTSENSPVIIEWGRWHKACRGKLFTSGRSHKYEVRNAGFKEKEKEVGNAA